MPHTVDRTIAFPASRYDKSLDGTGDYLNCPFSKAEYERFVDELIAAQAVESHIPNDVPYFEACLPIEEIARRGRDTLRFGPMKPMGLTDPRTGQRPWAAVQLRQENLRADSYNLVGFQNHLRFAEQKRILRLIPGLENAEFLRYGQIHRNTYINAPALLDATLQLRSHPNVFFAGQISGVEGYVESIATGLVAGMIAAARARGETPRSVPARNGDRLAVPLHLACRSAPLSAGKHRVRSVSAARSESARPQGAADRGLQTGARKTGRIRGHSCLSSRKPSRIFSASERAATIRHTRCATTARICANSSNTFRRQAASRPRSPPSICSACANGWRIFTTANKSPRPSAASWLRCVRSSDFFRASTGLQRDPARLLRLPKMPKTLPDVPNTEVTNALVDGSSREDLERPFPARDRLLLELLYGCGLRISEAVGLNLEDFDRSERWMRVRGKGRKERQVPYGSKSADGARCLSRGPPTFARIG